MNCHATRNLLDLHQEDRLTPGRARAVLAHLASCADCRALAGAVPLTVSAQAPASLKERLRAAAKAAPARAAEPPALPLWPSEARGVLLSATALAALAFLLGRGGEPTQPEEPASAAARRLP
jgi:hypothetical protein